MTKNLPNRYNVIFCGICKQNIHSSYTVHFAFMSKINRANLKSCDITNGFCHSCYMSPELIK